MVGHTLEVCDKAGDPVLDKQGKTKMEEYDEKAINPVVIRGK